MAMTRMWRGPCEALKATNADALWAAIHRRGGRLNIACNVAHDGRSANFFRVEKIRGEWFQFDLGRVEGGDPYSTVLAGYRRYTPLDAELLTQNHSYLERMAEDIVLDGNAIVAKLGQAADCFLP
jgi:hypothetical protein